MSTRKRKPAAETLPPADANFKVGATYLSDRPEGFGRLSRFLGQHGGFLVFLDLDTGETRHFGHAGPGYEFDPGREVSVHEIARMRKAKREEETPPPRPPGASPNRSAPGGPKSAYEGGL